MFSPAYQQLIQRNLQTAPPAPPLRLREGGFGTHFKDTPPPFVADTKVDNKIERLKKPKQKKKKKPKIKYTK